MTEQTTTETDPFEGWFIDEADPDVGIFGDAVIHEACAENVEGDAATIDVAIRDEGDDVVLTTTFTCPACSGTTSYDERQPREWFEEGR